MKTAILILTLAAGAFGQQYLPCLIDVAPPGFNATMRINLPGADPMPQRVHSPEWKLRPESTAFWNVTAGNAQDIFVMMPVAGTCSGSFESADNRADLTKVVTDAAGRHFHVRPPEQRGDVQILIVDEIGWRNFANGRNYEAYGATPRSTGGEFSFDLPAGYFRLVINNMFGSLGSKWVRLTIGSGPPPEPRNPLPGAVTVTRDPPRP
jgi:hypothetical protein